MSAIACAPVSWGPAPVPGGAFRRCLACGCKVHVSPASQRLLAEEPGIRVYCTPCVDAGKAGRITALAMTADQLAEAAEIDRKGRS